MIGACDAIPAYTPLPLAAATAAPVSVKRHAGVNCKNRLSIILVRKRSLHLCPRWRPSYTYISLFWQSTTLRSCRPAAVRPPSSSSLQLSARVAAVAVADCFDGSLCDALPAYTRDLSLLLLLLLLSSVKRHGGVNYKNRLNIIFVRKRSLYLCQGCIYDIVPYQESTTLQLCRTAAAVGNTIYVRSQMTRQQTACGEHNATTLPHSSSGRQHHICARGVSSLCCSKLLVSEPVICRPTPPHVSAVHRNLCK